MTAHNFYLMNNQTKIEITGTPSGFIMCGLPQGGAAVSNTPRTDELAKRDFITDGVWIRHARELERENAALRAWKESALAVEREWDAQAIATMLGAKPGESCRKAIAREVPKLVDENAALRAELEAQAVVNGKGSEREAKLLAEVAKLQGCVDRVSAANDLLLAEKTALRNEIARLNGQTNWLCSCGGTDCEGRKENVALRELLNEPYQFFRFGHKALMPWGNALDDWCERADKFGVAKKAQP